ncbi:MAG: MmgE/PrpD family protein [Dehalococcoidia bacterium]|nr:MmgE/PrpD family protein [Dehalococcoidia bacterium]
MNEDSYAQRLSDFVEGTEFEDLPVEVVDYTKRIILDTLGCAIGGYTLNRSKLIVDVARELGGKPESSILVTGDRVSSSAAAFANADMANALDADDTFLNYTHFANVVLADALAVAERVGANGKDLILAVALGFDVAARISLSLTFAELAENGPRLKIGQVTGMGYITIGGAVAAGKLLALDRFKMADAIGIAGSICPSPAVGKLGRSPRWTSQKYAPYMIMGLSGTLAALLAAKGYHGDRTILDGDVGFWRFQGATSCASEFMANDLGSKWWILETSVKPYPNCRYTHPGLDIFLSLMEEQQLNSANIESVTVSVNPVLWIRAGVFICTRSRSSRY